MLTWTPYQSTMQKEWDDVAHQYGSIFHTTKFRQLLLDTFGYSCAYHALIDENKKIQAIVPLISGRNLSVQTVGVSLPFANYVDGCATNDVAREQMLHAVQQHRTKQGWSSVELRWIDHPQRNYDHQQWHLLTDHHYTFKLPLFPNEEETLALSSSSNRNHVRKVYRKETFSCSFDPVHLDAFYEVYVSRMKQLGSPAPSITFFRNFWKYLPESTTLLSVLDRATGEVVGGMLLLASPSNSTLYYPYGSCRVEYNAQYINNFMYWEAVRLGIRLGLQTLDLGRSQVGSGTYKFKQQWGASAVPLLYMIASNHSTPGHLALDKDRLGPAIEIWKKLPRLITDPAGKTLIRFLMP